MVLVVATLKLAAARAEVGDQPVDAGVAEALLGGDVFIGRADHARCEYQHNHRGDQTMFYDDHAGRFGSPVHPDTKARFRAEYYQNRQPHSDGSEPEPTHVSGANMSIRERVASSIGRFVRTSRP